MKKITVKNIGFGTGAGEEIKILSREDIENIIDVLDPEDIFKEAFDHWNQGYLTGEAQLDLQTGKLTGGAYPPNTHDQACDAIYITLYSISQNDELIIAGENCSCAYNEQSECDDNCDATIDEDGYPYDWTEFLWGWKGSKTNQIKEQLDNWYK